MREALLKLGEVKEITRLSTSTIYRMVKDKTFPSPRKVRKSNLWKLSEINTWVESL